MNTEYNTYTKVLNEYYFNIIDIKKVYVYLSDIIIDNNISDSLYEC